MFWALIALHLLVYPHLAFWLARRAANSQRAEMNNLAMDCLFFGILGAALQFPLWIVFTVYIASTLNITLSRGMPGFIQSQLAFFGGVLATVAAIGWHVSPDTGWATTLMCLIGNVVYMDVRQSMRNGGGPACLRLRVVLGEEEKNQIGAQVFWNENLDADLRRWVGKHYRDRLLPQDLAETLWRIRRPFSRSHSRSLVALRLSCSALPLASAISAFTRPPL